MREDSQLPLYVVGSGFTEVASAILKRPEIRRVLRWSGSAATARPIRHAPRRTPASTSTLQISFSTRPDGNIVSDGLPAGITGGGTRSVRLYRSIDTRMRFADMFAKLAINNPDIP
jgi:hypothetical protein